jgi:hypothetical protein
VIAVFAAAAPMPAQQNFCGVTPESAKLIATEMMRQAGYAYDSATPAYYVSVMAPRLAPFFVVFFIRDGMVVGEIEVDFCGRQDTPHPGVQYAPESDIPFESLLLEPDAAFAAVEEANGVEVMFGSRIFPYGLTPHANDLNAIDFWWIMLDADGKWHYLSKYGEPQTVIAPRSD